MTEKKKPTIVWASQIKVDELAEEIYLLLQKIGHPETWVTDESMIGDFCLDTEELVMLSASVGFEIKHDDYLVDIAYRMKG